MNRSTDVLATALAPAIWGSTYIITTGLLPAGYPLTVAMLRALPAGLLLLLWARRLPQGVWWLRAALLGTLNFSIFWAMLFVTAYRLPGGVAATLGSIQTLIVIVLARALLGTPIRALSVIAALAGMGGVALLVLTPEAALDPVGIAAGLVGAVAMALGTVLSRRWQPPVPPLAFAAWQLVAGGLAGAVRLVAGAGAAQPDAGAPERLRISGGDRRRIHVRAVVPRPGPAGAHGGRFARFPESADRGNAGLGPARRAPERMADRRHGRRDRQRVAGAAGPAGRGGPARHR